MLKLLLPVLFPSWRFFSSIGPSPRIQFSLLTSDAEESHQWQDFRSQPLQVSFKDFMIRLFWNPQWNERLYMNTCAERLFEEYSPEREYEITKRIITAIHADEIAHQFIETHLQFRICAVIREGNDITQHVVFISKPVAIKDYQ